jgi:hypothetical protein
MGFKGDQCTCDGYCDCVYPPSRPCECKGMMKDPHCMYCCQHLTNEQEVLWRQEMGEPVVGGVSDCCGSLVEERVLQTYGGETILHICRTCGKNCQSVAVPKEY